MNWSRPSASAPPRLARKPCRPSSESHMNTKILCASLLTLACMGAAMADTPIYKWVDDQGQVHYSTVPHSDKAQQLGIQNTAAPHAGTDVAPAPGASTNPAANDAALVMPQPSDLP